MMMAESETIPDPAAATVRKIIHVDMDAFFAAVEQRDDPALCGLPVAVGGDSPRGVVAAASYEARRFGVRSAMPAVTARRRCPDLVFVRPRFDVYRAVSLQIRAIFADYTDLIEPLSLDEAYLDVTANRRGHPSATAIAEEIRARIRAETRLTASAGISYNKFLAKLASEHNKPDGLHVIPPRLGAAFVAALPVAKFHGVGPATAARMNRLGITTGADLAACPLAVLETHFGKSGRFFHDIARGIDLRPVRPDRVRKSLGAEDTFFTDIFALDHARTEMRPITAKVWAAATRNRIHARTVTLKAKYADFRVVTRSRTLPVPIGSESELVWLTDALLAPLFPTDLGFRLFGVTLSTLGGAGEPEAPANGQLALDF
ncbi:DNA polymerase IV [Rhabdaerophilum calidifontis]|uniref:DNA polymerase IV n=1 Tax=Rhabdaerophilum calidifontis TaxID=2604328 RepID=UPI00123B4D5F|nr:DNA polymerase IV [Rhabdaerophilum calidifontis]